MPYTICHKNFMTHLFAYRLGYWEAVLSIAIDFSKAVISLLQRYQCFVITVNEYEFLFHNIFSLLLTSVSNVYNICSILYHSIGKCMTGVIHLVHRGCKLTVFINTVLEM